MTTDTTAKPTASHKHTLTGVVVSDKMKDTIVVLVERYLKNPKYGKFLRKSKRYKAHDAGNTRKVGEKVVIEECRPISKDKRFKVLVLKA